MNATHARPSLRFTHRYYAGAGLHGSDTRRLRHDSAFQGASTISSFHSIVPRRPFYPARDRELATEYVCESSDLFGVSLAAL